MSDSISAVAMTWRACPGYPEYEVSDCGDVRRSLSVDVQPGRRLRGTIDADGYIRFSLRSRDGVQRHELAHRLVAAAFIGPAPSAMHEVAHRNGSRLCNMRTNLRWALPVENHADRVTHGTAPVGVANGRAQITDDDVRFIRRRYREIKLARGNVAELDRRFGLSRSQIIRIAQGQAWSHVQ